MWSLINVSSNLHTTDVVGNVGCGGPVVKRRTSGREEWGSELPVAKSRIFRSKGQGFKTTCCRFKTCTVSFTQLCPCLSEDTKSRWSLLPAVYARGSKRCHTGGKCATYRGL